MDLPSGQAVCHALAKKPIPDEELQLELQDRRRVLFALPKSRRDFLKMHLSGITSSQRQKIYTEVISSDLSAVASLWKLSSAC